MRRQRDAPVGLGGPVAVADPRPKTPRPLRTTVLAVGVVVLVIAWIRYLPVAEGAATACPDGAEDIPAEQLTVTELDELGGAAGLCRVRNVHTTRATVTARVRNDGPVAARLTGVRLSAVPGLFDVEGLAVGSADAPLEATRAEPVRGSARLPGHSERVVAVTIVLPDCEHVEQPRVATFAELPLRVRVLGLPRDLDLALDPALRVQSETCTR